MKGRRDWEEVEREEKKWLRRNCQSYRNKRPVATCVTQHEWHVVVVFRSTVVPPTLSGLRPNADRTEKARLPLFTWIPFQKGLKSERRSKEQVEMKTLVRNKDKHKSISHQLNMTDVRVWEKGNDLHQKSLFQRRVSMWGAWLTSFIMTTMTLKTCRDYSWKMCKSASRAWTNQTGSGWQMNMEGLLQLHICFCTFYQWFQFCRHVIKYTKWSVSKVKMLMVDHPRVTSTTVTWYELSLGVEVELRQRFSCVIISTRSDTTWDTNYNKTPDWPELESLYVRHQKHLCFANTLY